MPEEPTGEGTPATSAASGIEVIPSFAGNEQAVVAANALVDEIRSQNTKTDIGAILYELKGNNEEWQQILVGHVKHLVKDRKLDPADPEFKQIFMRGVPKNTEGAVDAGDNPAASEEKVETT